MATDYRFAHIKPPVKELTEEERLAKEAAEKAEWEASPEYAELREMAHAYNSAQAIEQADATIAESHASSPEWGKIPFVDDRSLYSKAGKIDEAVSIILDPDRPKHAGAIDLAKKTGLNVWDVMDQYDAIKRYVESAHDTVGFNADEFITRFPKIAQMLSERPETVTIVQSDTNFVAKALDLARMVPTTALYVHNLLDPTKSNEPIPDFPSLPETPWFAQKEIDVPKDSVPDGVWDRFKRSWNLGNMNVEEAHLGWNLMSAIEESDPTKIEALERRLANLQNKKEKTLAPSDNAALNVLQEAASSLPFSLEVMKVGGPGAVVGGVAGGFVGSLAGPGGTVGGAVTGARILGALAGGQMSRRLEAGSAFLEYRDMMTDPWVDANGVFHPSQRIAPKDAMRYANGYGWIASGIESMDLYFSLGVGGLSKLKKASGLQKLVTSQVKEELKRDVLETGLSRTAKGLAAGMISEGVEEMFQGGAQDWIGHNLKNYTAGGGQKIDWKEFVSSRGQELVVGAIAGMAPGITMSTVSAITDAGFRELGRQRLQSDALTQGMILAGIQKGLADKPLEERRSMGAGVDGYWHLPGGTAINEVYIDAQAFTEFFARDGLDVRDALPQLFEGEKLNSAIKSLQYGLPVEVPMATYVGEFGRFTNAKGVELGAYVAEHSTFNALEMTSAQVQQQKAAEDELVTYMTDTLASEGPVDMNVVEELLKKGAFVGGRDDVEVAQLLLASQRAVANKVPEAMEVLAKAGNKKVTEEQAKIALQMAAARQMMLVMRDGGLSPAQLSEMFAAVRFDVDELVDAVKEAEQRGIKPAPKSEKPSKDGPPTTTSHSGEKKASKSEPSAPISELAQGPVPADVPLGNIDVVDQHIERLGGAQSDALQRAVLTHPNSAALSADAFLDTLAPDQPVAVFDLEGKKFINDVGGHAYLDGAVRVIASIANKYAPKQTAQMTTMVFAAVNQNTAAQIASEIETALPGLGVTYEVMTKNEAEARSPGEPMLRVLEELAGETNRQKITEGRRTDRFAPPRGLFEDPEVPVDWAAKPPHQLDVAAELELPIDSPEIQTEFARRQGDFEALKARRDEINASAWARLREGVNPDAWLDAPVIEGIELPMGSRQRVADMNQEQLRKFFMKDGLLKWQGDLLLGDEGEAFVSLDMSGLKSINEHFGREMADRILAVFRNAMLKAGGDQFYAAHLHGDEFKARLTKETKATFEQLAKERNELVVNPLEVFKNDLAKRASKLTLYHINDNGDVVTLEGVAFQYGFGETFEKADENIKAQNAVRPGGKPFVQVVEHQGEINEPGQATSSLQRRGSEGLKENGENADASDGGRGSYEGDSPIIEATVGARAEGHGGALLPGDPRGQNAGGSVAGEQKEDSGSTRRSSSGSESPGLRGGDEVLGAALGENARGDSRNKEKRGNGSTQHTGERGDGSQEQRVASRIDVYRGLSDAQRDTLIERLNAAGFASLAEWRPEAHDYAVGQELSPSAGGITELKQDARGRLRVSEEDGRKIYRVLLNEDSDVSTLVHELGHIYLLQFEGFARQPNASPRVVDDYAKMRSWLGVKDFDELTVEHHEKLARGFEAYLMEGNSPSEGLERPFSRLKDWLKQIYGDVSKLDVELNDELRGVFDRLIATDQQIEEAVRLNSERPYSPSVLGVPADENFLEFLDDQEEAVKATSRYGQMQAYKKKLVALDKKWRDWHSSELNAERERIESSPGYRALKLITTGKFGRFELPQKIKLNRDEVIDTFGTIPEGLKALVSKDGKTFIEIAELTLSAPSLMTAFGSVHEFFTSIAAAPRDARKQAIKNTDAAFKEYHREELLAAREELLEKIEEFQFSEKVLRDAVAAANKIGGRNDPSTAEFKAAARQLVDARPLNSLSVHQFRMNERRARNSEAYALSRGEKEQARYYRTQAVLNSFIVSEILSAQKASASMLKRISKFSDEKYRKRIGKKDELTVGEDGSLSSPLIDVADSLTEAVGIKPVTASSAQIEARAGLPQLKAFFDEREIVWKADEAVLQGILSNPRSWDRLTPVEQREVNNVLQQIQHVERGEVVFELNEKTYAVAEVVSALEATISGKDKGFVLADKTTESFVSKLGTKALHLPRGLLDAEREFSRLGKPGEDLFMTIVESQITKDKLGQKLLLEVDKKLFAPDSPFIKRGREKIQLPPGLKLPEGYGGDLSRSWLHALMPNMGNASNRLRLYDGFGGEKNGWTDQNVLPWLDSVMTKEEWDTVQALWDLFGKYLKPEVVRVYRELHGIPMDEIEAIPIVTRHGVYPGGYYPVFFDQAMSNAGEAQRNVTDNRKGAFYTTAQHFTKGRVSRVYNAPLELNLERVFPEIASVVHYIAYEKNIRTGSRFFGNSEIRSIILRHLDEDWLARFNDTLHVAAMGPESLNKGWLPAFLERSFYASVLGLRPHIALGDLVRPISAALYGDLSMGDALWSLSTFWNADKLAKEKSRFRPTLLANTSTRFESSRERQQRKGRRSWHEFMADTMFIFLDWSTRLTSGVIFDAKYREGIRKGLSEEEAVKAADKVLLQHMPNVIDWMKAPAHRNTVGRLLTVFASEGLKMASIHDRKIREAIAQAKVGNFGPAALIVVRMAAGFFMLNLGAQLLMGRGKDDDEDWTQWAMRESLKGALAQDPLIGKNVISPALVTAFGLGDKTQAGSKFRSPPLEAGQDWVKQLADLGHAIVSDEKDIMFSDVIDAVGVPLLLPTGAAKQWLGPLLDDQDTDPIEGPIDLGELFIYGQRANRPANPINMVAGKN